ncbi:Glioma tumor suppressor candidate region protein 2 [Desmophyllum pertusum]|uniref:Ribosome biogenesis protein NOP53 n=1 Tax=Desmophyllum pertusum TaxID=174260 RepID=A0A9W9ZNQ9_9CNID|nr:Glioma tumor suppressor candidate region protein 2 [Desmophyllum pertusum]
MAATTKRKRVSKKSKQSWRKHTDIKDVEEHLEEARREERTGGPVSEKPDKGLFFVDKETEEIKTTGKPKVRSRKRKLLKADQLLLPESKIKPVGSKRRKINEKNRQADSDSSDSDVDEEKSRPVAVERNNNRLKTVAKFDLWETQDLHTGDEHFLTTTRRSKVKKPKSINRKTSELEAVEVCAPGASYNPAYEDHQLLLQSAHDVESRKVKEIEKLKRQVKFLTPEEAANLPTWTEEMSQGLFVEDDKEVDEAESSDECEGMTVGPVRAVDRKTKQQRRKEKEKEEEQKRLETEKKEKLRQNEIFRLKTLKKEIKMADLEAEDRKKQKEEIEKSSATKPKRLGKHQYEAPNIEIQLSGEMTGSLRTLKQEGNLFEDRFKSLQRRNIIEPRQPVKPHRKYKQKTYTRKSYDKPCIKEI